MRIAASDLAYGVSHLNTSQRTVQETLRAWVGPRRPDFEGSGRGNAARVELPAPPPPPPPAKAAAATESAALQDAVAEVESDPRLQLIKMMVEAMTGERIRVFRPEDVPAASPTPELTDPHQATAARAAPQRANFGVEYDRHETLDEKETTQFSAQGVIRTTDGKEIAFSVQFALDREFHQESNQSLRLGDARRKDPLVINFAGTAAELLDQRFAFDLAGDGRKENLPLLGNGSGYLVFDRNADGKVNSGQELFGPASGNGFNELAKLDQDGNGWIDQNDPAFGKLAVWSPQADGSGGLRSLASAGVGAIAVNAAATAFEYRNAANASLGSLRSSGVYLSEDGKAGTVQQIDLTV